MSKHSYLDQILDLVKGKDEKERTEILKFDVSSAGVVHIDPSQLLEIGSVKHQFDALKHIQRLRDQKHADEEHAC